MQSGLHHLLLPYYHTMQGNGAGLRCSPPLQPTAQVMAVLRAAQQPANVSRVAEEDLLPDEIEVFE
jgi:hypothetical protein